MICEKHKELKVLKYAKENYYTILANTFGSIEFVKYDDSTNRATKFLKWFKGTSKLTLTCGKEETIVYLSEIK